MAKRNRKKRAKSSRAYTPDLVLINWRELKQALPNMTEGELEDALKVESETQQRRDFLYLLHRRFSALRKKREKAELKIPDAGSRVGA